MTTHPAPEVRRAARGTPAEIRLVADQAEPGLVLTQNMSVLSGPQRGLEEPGLTDRYLELTAERSDAVERHVERR